MPARTERVPGTEIALLNPNRYRGIDCEALQAWLAPLLREVASDATSLAVRFVGDRAMRDLNARFRDLDRTADVLSFPGESTPEGHHLGDIAIAVPVARRQARELGHPLERELKCLMLHGVLHCLGHDHEADGGEMKRLELRLRERWIDREGRSE